jgi:putative intracellular protease/amidase
MTMTRNKARFLLMTSFAMAVGVALTGNGGCGTPASAPSTAGASSVPADEHAATIAAMRPPKRDRPVVAVLADNDGTETTDFIVPYAVLAASGAADVLAVAPEARAVKLTPALAIQPQATTGLFDARYPDGADYVLVPKIDDTADPAVIAWIQAQADKGSMIVGICSGVKTVAAAGLVDGRQATGHWFDIEGLRKAHPTMRWVRDRRYVVDGPLMTTTGVTASLPASLALVEAIAGTERTAALAAELGVQTWDARHDSSAFALDPTSKGIAARNRSRTAPPDLWAVPVFPGVDDIALSFQADAWSRTYRSKALAIATTGDRVVTRYGLELVPDAIGEPPAGATALAPPPSTQPATVLPVALAAIADHYGDGTARFIALQLEYAWSAEASPRW